MQPLLALAGQLAVFVHLIERLQQLVLLEDEGHGCLKHLFGLGIAAVQGNELGRAQFGFQLLQFGAADLGEVPAVDPAMERRLGRKMMRVVAYPAVVMDRGVQRLRRIPDVMAHDTHHINDILLGIGDFLRRSAVLLKGLQVRKA